MKKQDGFTLIEILMAVLIIVILAVVGITQFQNFAADAKNASTKSNLAILRNSIGTMNALERVRCAKTTNLFPDVSTINDNDITSCSAAGVLVPGGTAGAACNPNTLINPAVVPLAAFGPCTAGGDATATAGAFLGLIPLIDRPYVQNQIPVNPWTGPTTTAAANLVTADTAPAAGSILCQSSPIILPGVTAKNAALCAAGTMASPFTTHGGTSLITDDAASPPTQSGWCYCQQTGQIWANTANNDGGLTAGGKPDGLGTESQF